MAINVRDEGRKVNSSINVTPMVDVMLVLLVIFMMVTPMIRKDVDVTLAETEHPKQMPDADRDDAILVAITRDNMVYLGKDKIAAADLGLKVRELQSKGEKPLFIRADARSKFVTVEDVVDNIRAAGISQIGLLTEQRRNDQIIQ